MTDKDVDEQFAAIVAHWDEQAPERPAGPAAQSGPRQTHPHPQAQQSGAPMSPPAPDRSAGPIRPTGPVRRTGPIGPAPVAPSTGNPPPRWRAHEVPTDPDDEHYRPDPPRPLPHDAMFRLTLAALVLGPLAVLGLAIGQPTDSGWWMVTAIGVTFAGLVLLVLRQPLRREDRDDDGARR